MNRPTMGALEVVVPLQNASTPVLCQLAQTASSLDMLSVAGLGVTLALVGDRGARDSAQLWLIENAPALGVRQLDVTWAGTCSILALGDYVSTPYFAVLEPGDRFTWPDDVPLAAIAQGTLCFEPPITHAGAQMAFWIGGNLTPLNLGAMRGTALWHAGLCERARIMLARLDDGRKAPWLHLDLWRAYLAVNEERLVGAHRLVQASANSGSPRPTAYPVE